MNDSAIEDLYDWLRDAHAMEEQAEKLFRGQADRLKDYLGVQSKLETEAQYAHEHQRMLELRIKQLGTNTSTVKDATGKIVASIQNISGMAMSDEPVKGILALYTFAQMELASFKIIAAAAKVLNDRGTHGICEAILERINLRTQWMSNELERITRTFMTAQVA